jgi:hypothetical protein
VSRSSTVMKWPGLTHVAVGHGEVGALLGPSAVRGVGPGPARVRSGAGVGVVGEAKCLLAHGAPGRVDVHGGKGAERVAVGGRVGGHGGLEVAELVAGLVDPLPGGSAGEVAALGGEGLVRELVDVVRHEGRPYRWQSREVGGRDQDAAKEAVAKE